MLVKYFRSSRLAKAANCETLFRRTSTKRPIPASFNLVKKISADFLVKPIVKSFIAGRFYSQSAASGSSNAGSGRINDPGIFEHLSAYPRLEPTIGHEIDFAPNQEFQFLASEIALLEARDGGSRDRSPRPAPQVL